MQRRIVDILSASCLRGGLSLVCFEMGEGDEIFKEDGAVIQKKSRKGRQEGVQRMSLSCLLLCGCLFVGWLQIPREARAEDADAVVKFRKALMQETKVSLLGISLLLKGEISDKESFALQAQILSLASERAGKAFVFRTRGLTESTTAHERVWTEQTKFQSRMEKFAKDTKTFADLASRSASSKKLGSAFKGLVKQCKSCHQRYRIEHKHK